MAILTDAEKAAAAAGSDGDVVVWATVRSVGHAADSNGFALDRRTERAYEEGCVRGAISTRKGASRRSALPRSRPPAGAKHEPKWP